MCNQILFSCFLFIPVVERLQAIAGWDCQPNPLFVSFAPKTIKSVAVRACVRAREFVRARMCGSVEKDLHVPGAVNPLWRLRSPSFF